MKKLLHLLGSFGDKILLFDGMNETQRPTSLVEETLSCGKCESMVDRKGKGGALKIESTMSF